MGHLHYPRQQIAERASFSAQDREWIDRCRGNHQRLGFAYQMAFVQLLGRFPSQQPLELFEDLICFVASELDLDGEAIHQYAQRRPTVSEHQEQIRNYLQLRRLELAESKLLKQYLFQEACHLEQTSALRAKAQQFLQEQSILVPADSTLNRLIGEQRDLARQSIFEHIKEYITSELQAQIDALLQVTDGRVSKFQVLKEPPGSPSPKAFTRLTEKLDRIEATGVLGLDLGWLNNNFQKTLARRARQYTAYKLRELKAAHQYAVMVCFLWQTYQDTIDQIVQMFDRLITSTERRAENQFNELAVKQRGSMRLLLAMLKTMGRVLLDKGIPDREVRHKVFKELSPEMLEDELLQLDEWLTGAKSNAFPLVINRFNYVRKFSPSFLDYVELKSEATESESLIEAIDIIKQMNAEGKRKIPNEAPLDFIPQRLERFVNPDNHINRQAYECAVLICINDEIKRGNLWIPYSKRYGRLDDFFISDEQWNAMRTGFFKRAKLPCQAAAVGPYLTEQLNFAFEHFLRSLSHNTHVTMDADGWHFSKDQAETLESEDEQKLENLQQWLSKRMRTIKLPDLLIEVDNELHLSRHFVTTAKQEERKVEDICTVIATIMAYGCNIGPQTMAQLTQGVSYSKIKHIADWYLHGETLRAALADVVNAITGLDTIRVWGEGKTSSSDGQRFLFPQKVLQRTYSPRFGDYALEFYSFISDNYAPFYSVPIECTQRDAAFVLDGLLYHESDLDPEEHYTDTHGYTEINFAAFAMLGRRFCPRIRGLQDQWIYRIDKHKDYGPLTPLVDDSKHTIHLDWIIDQWDRIGQFYASLETGHATASVALQRLVSFSSRNQFYRANLELGRVFKTEFILKYNSNPALRRRIQRGLLKGEQLHGLAKDVFYGKQGRISARDLHQQISTASCLNLILACIIYWQAKEIGRALSQHDPVEDGVDPSLLEHISPIGWDNVILYGEYILNPKLIY